MPTATESTSDMMSCVEHVRFGSLADLFTNLSLMSAFECKADILLGRFRQI